MSRHVPFYHWQEQVVKCFAQGTLSRPQACGLAILSFGIVRAASCALTAIAGKLPFLGSDNTVRQRLKYWLRDGQGKRTPQQPQVNVRVAFLPLIRWILSLWQGSRLVLAIDATTLHDDLLVLAIALLYRGTAIPLAWAMLPANRKQPWLPVILDLVKIVAQAIPRSYQVLVLADRGLYSPRLYRSLRRRHWHALLRINNQACFRARQQSWQRIARLLPGPGYQWRGRGQLSKKNPLRCTLVVFWAQGQKEAWFLVTDLGPVQARAAPYALRVWIEEGFRVLKSIGWQWQHSRITDPHRAERLWLALAVATVWTLAYGTWVEDHRTGSPAPREVVALPELVPVTPVEGEAAISFQGIQPVCALGRTTRPRQKSIFRLGLEALAERVWGRKRPLKRLILTPDPWPEVPENG
jgi:hypothetical protein